MLSRYAFALASVGVVGLSAGSGCVEMDETSAAQQSLGLVQQSPGLNDRIAACASDPRVVAGTASVDVCVGADLFLRETFGGNGRSCATCHRVDNNFTIDPAFIAKLPPNDPLFVAEFNPDLAGLEIPAVMRLQLSPPSVLRSTPLTSSTRATAGAVECCNRTVDPRR